MRARNVSDTSSFTNEETKATRELISKVNAVFQVKGVIKSCSKARGDSNDNSDVDIMVIIEEEETKQKRNKLSEISYEVNYKYDTNIYVGLGYARMIV